MIIADMVERPVQRISHVEIINVIKAIKNGKAARFFEVNVK